MCILSLVIVKPLKHFIVSVLTQKPYNLLWIVALLMFALSLVSTSAFDITLHDSYYVLSVALIYQLFALLLVIFWLIYLFADGILLSKSLTRIHILATLIPTIIFFMLAKLDWGMSGVPRRYYALTAFNTRPEYKALIAYLAIIALFLIGQLCFLINLVAGPVKYFTVTRKTR